MTVNLPLIGSRRGADILGSASAAVGDTSGLKNAVSGSNLGLIEASIWRISAKMPGHNHDCCRFPIKEPT
jgi:hypothetical protein